MIDRLRLWFAAHLALGIAIISVIVAAIATVLM